MESRVIQCLIDTGCTTNLLSKHIFDKLSTETRARLAECNGHGLMADGTQLPFYGTIRLPVRLREVRTEETFVVSRISEDAILGMPFLISHRCALDFGRPVVRVDGKELQCTDRHGRLLANLVQVVRDVVIPPRTEQTVTGRVTSRNYCPMGLVEAQIDGPTIATSLNLPS
jgi:hypothetical protein